ncbi:MAG: amidohydrolase family protein [Tetrasphaera sp.]|nr:amidohydrolase family protein [Tetrasphaera sp.]
MATSPTQPQILAAARVFTPDELFSPGWVEVANGRVMAVGGGPAYRSGAGTIVDLGDVTIAPGFVDLHAHGGGGASYTDGAQAATLARAMHLSHGSTSGMASLVTDTVERLADQIRALRPLVDRVDLLGVHLEGPWLAPRYRGAHDPSLLRTPSGEDVDRLLRAGPIAMVTIAPEVPGGLAAICRLVDAGVLVAIGHSDATYAEARTAFAEGARILTHMHKAHRPLHHREPGPAQAALGSPGVILEVIADGVHVHPAVVADILRTRPGRVALVADAMAAAGAGDEDYRLGPLNAVVRGGVARIGGPDGPIAGSTLTLDRALRWAVDSGVEFSVALSAATRIPADVIGRGDLGRLTPGARADLVVLDPSLPVTSVMRGCHWI